MNTNCINDNHFNIIISEETEKEKEKDDDDNSDDNPLLNINNEATADIVTNKDGMVYVLPMSPIQFDTVKRYLIKETDSTLLIKYIQSR